MQNLTFVDGNAKGQGPDRGGAISNDGNTFTLTLRSTRIENNHANEGAAAVFFASTDRSDFLIIEDLVLVSNPSEGFETRG